jgi:hypothetical protein
MDVAVSKRKNTSRSDLTTREGRWIEQPRDLEWFLWLNHHGPLSVPYLVEAVSESHPTTLNAAAVRLGILSRYGEMQVDRPGQRFYTVPRTSFEIYANSPEIDEDLLTRGLIPHSSARLSQRLLHHEVFLAHFTASIELGARKHGIRFIHQTDVVKKAPVEMECKISHVFDVWDKERKYRKEELHSATANLHPDRIFQLEDDGDYCTFFVEVDCGNEFTKTSDLHRTNAWYPKILKYIFAIETGLYKKQFGIESPARVLLVFNSLSKMRAVMEAVEDITNGKGKNFFCFMLWPEFANRFFVPDEVNYGMFESPYTRVGIDPKTHLAYQPYFLV